MSLTISDNLQNVEEDEDLEEQRRRDEELSDLLAGGIDAFDHDESTLNSSLTSAEGEKSHISVRNKNPLRYEDSGKTSISEVMGQNYRDASQQEQLKILYDIRVREVHNLRKEFDDFKDEKAQEIKVLKTKLTLLEAEIRHLQVTLANSESLLVEKNDIIRDVNKDVASKDEEIASLKKLVEEQNLEICTYKSTVSELHLKLADNNPFSNSARKFKSEELQKAHQDQIIKLETLLQEQNKKVQILEKEKFRLEEDVRKLVQTNKEIEEENNLTIMGLSKKLNGAQQQCRDLFLLGEAIKKESDHFKERLQQFDSNKLDLSGDGLQVKKMDKDTMIMHMEKLKRMLLDKDIELNTLTAKLKFYDSDLSELFEYRQLFQKMYSSEVKRCSNSEHEELIIFMQGQLQSYQQAVEDRNNQIISLNSVNEELREKIEEMLQQTRNDIQNISQKYSLPQLETMSNELKNAEISINNLRQEAADKEELIKKLTEENKELIEERKRIEEDLNKRTAGENERVKTQLQKICLKLGLTEADIFECDDADEFSNLKTKYGKIHDQLEQIFLHLESTNSKKANFNIIFKLKKQLESCLDQKFEQKQILESLEQWDNMLIDFIETLRNGESSKEINSLEDLTNAKIMLEGEKFALEYQLKSRNLELEEAKKEIAIRNEENEQNSRTIQKMNDQISNLKKCLQLTEENKAEVEKQLEITQKQLLEAKQETINLHKEVNEASENVVKNNLCKELDVLEKTDDGSEKNLQARLLKAEISLRDRLQEENVKKMQRIEEQYRRVLAEKVEMYAKEKEKWRRQETNYRKQFAAVLEECGRKMEELEKDNNDLIRRINALVREYNTFKASAMFSMNKYNAMVANCKKTIEDLNQKWALILEPYMYGVKKIDKQQQKSAKIILQKINISQKEVELVEQMFDERIRNFKAQHSCRK